MADARVVQHAEVVLRQVSGTPQSVLEFLSAALSLRWVVTICRR